MSTQFTCPDPCDLNRTWVAAYDLNGYRHNDSCDKTDNDCRDLKKGSGPWGRGGTAAAVTDAKGMLLYDMTTRCGCHGAGSGQGQTAVCVRSGYDETDADLDKCCLNTDPYTHGPTQCPPDMCSSPTGMSQKCLAYLLEKVTKDPVFAAAQYEDIKSKVPLAQVTSSYLSLCSNPANLMTTACSVFCQDPECASG